MNFCIVEKSTCVYTYICIYPSDLFQLDEFFLQNDLVVKKGTYACELLISELVDSIQECYVQVR